MEWEVWLTGGRRRTSLDCAWGEWPEGVLVVRRWNPDGVNWGDGLYGDPATWKNAGMTDDATFSATLAEARATRTPPSER